MNNKQFIIQHPSQLNALSTLPFMRRAGLGQIVLAEAFHHQDKAQMEQNLNKNYYACGCSHGAKALLMGMLVFGGAGLFGFFSNDWSASKSLTTFLGGTILASLTGKLFGLAAANGKLKKTIKEIQMVWKTDDPKVKLIDCG